MYIDVLGNTFFKTVPGVIGYSVQCTVYSVQPPKAVVLFFLTAVGSDFSDNQLFHPPSWIFEFFDL